MENELMMVEYLIIWMVFSCGMAVVSYFMRKNKRKEVRNLLEGSGEKVCMTLNGGGSTLDLPVCVLASLVMPGAYCFAWAFVGGMEGTLEGEELSMFSYALIFIAFLMLAVMVLLFKRFYKNVSYAFILEHDIVSYNGFGYAAPKRYPLRELKFKVEKQRYNVEIYSFTDKDGREMIRIRKEDLPKYPDLAELCARPRE